MKYRPPFTLYRVGVALFMAAELDCVWCFPFRKSIMMIPVILVVILVVILFFFEWGFPFPVVKPAAGVMVWELSLSLSSRQRICTLTTGDLPQIKHYRQGDLS